MNSTIRSVARHVALDIMGAFSRPSPYVHILNGHMITRNAGSGSDNDRQRYLRLLTRLKKQCDFVNFEDAVSMIVNRVEVQRPTLAFSFDDGFEDCYTHLAPALELFGINAMFFINPNFADAGQRGDEQYIKHFTEAVTLSPGKRPMNWTQIRELQGRGFLFGAHTLDHYMVNSGSVAELRHQIIDCRKAIENRLQTPCEYFAWPYGRLTHVNQDAVNLACNTYQYVFSQSDHRHFFSFDRRVINRRHAEAWWPITHIRYFIGCKRSY